MRKNIYLAKHGNDEILATISGKLFNESGTSLPAVGDWVLLRDSVISSILTRKNALSRGAAGGKNGKEIQLTAEVGVKLGKGRQTTTTRDLIVLPSGGMVIDNPGIREIALSTNMVGTTSTFPDIEEAALSCRFKDCSHTHEPGCKVLEQVFCEKIPLNRLKNYQKLKNEVNYHIQRENKGAARIEKERWKAVALKVKSIKKRR